MRKAGGLLLVVVLLATMLVSFMAPPALACHDKVTGSPTVEFACGAVHVPVDEEVAYWYAWLRDTAFDVYCIVFPDHPACW